MKFGDTIKPFSQPIDAGGLARLYGARPAADPAFLSTWSGSTLTPPTLVPPASSASATSPLVGKVIKVANADAVLGVEGGAGISTANAEQYWGRPGSLLRKRVRIDKCPWPDGQEDIRIRTTLNYAQSVGSITASSTADPVVVKMIWLRNTTKEFSLTSGTTPFNALQDAFGYVPGSVTVHFKLEAHGVGVGQPLVQDDGNPYTQTFITLDVTNAVFTNPADYWYTDQSRHHMLPCPQWSIHHINFPGDAHGFFVAAYFLSPIGLVMSVDWMIEAIGWDTGADDDYGYQTGLTEQGYEFPDTPLSSPYNAGLP